MKKASNIFLPVIGLLACLLCAPSEGKLSSDNDSGVYYAVTIDPWTQQAKLTASDGGFNDQFGASVSISGDTIVVGARYDDSYSAYVFEKPGGGWSNMTQTAKLTASDGASNDQFGHSVAISGDTVVVGARAHDGFKGAAYIFEKPGGGWSDMTQTAKLTASDGAPSDVFGHSVAISGDTVVVGADGDNVTYVDQGSAYVFEKPGGGWSDMTQTAKLTASDGTAYDEFGVSVAVNGDTVVVGADGDNVTYMDQGSAYVFAKPGGGWSDMTQTAKLTASDGAQDDYFGHSVAINEDTMVVGAYGVDKTISEVTYFDVGQSYVFDKPAGGWSDMTQTAKLTASDGEANDDFGYSVAISGNNVLVGAWGHDDNGLSSSGAAYVFEKPGTGWSDMIQTLKLTASDGAAYDWFGYSVAISGVTLAVGAHGDGTSGSAYVFEVADLCECDLNNDGKCDMQDWLVFGQDWGRTDCNDPGVEECECDINQDGKCDMQDWLVFGEDWGRTDCP